MTFLVTTPRPTNPPPEDDWAWCQRLLAEVTETMTARLQREGLLEAGERVVIEVTPGAPAQVRRQTSTNGPPAAE